MIVLGVVSVFVAVALCVFFGLMFFIVMLSQGESDE